MAEECGIKVVARFRPQNEREKNEKNEDGFKLEVGRQSVRLEGAGVGKHSFAFDRCFDPLSSQVEVFECVAKPLIEDVINGINATIFAYGQTGSGKTFTMFGPDLPDDVSTGIIPRASRQLFEAIYATQPESNLQFSVKASFLEIYKERIRDLLHPINDNLPIRQSPTRGIYVENLREVFVGGEEDIRDLLRKGEAARSVASTKMNERSSRSHSLFIVRVEQRNLDTGGLRVGRLNLVDLAGSEKISKTGAAGETLEEAKKINQSLSALGNCIHALTEAKRGHIPYRDSKLTRILQDSLGGNTKTCLVVTCSPHVFNIDETLTTLRFGARAKTIKNKVSVNVQRTAEELEIIVKALQEELKKWKDIAQGRSPLPPPSETRSSSSSSSSSSSEIATYDDGEDREDEEAKRQREEEEERARKEAEEEMERLKGQIRDLEEEIKRERAEGMGRMQEIGDLTKAKKDLEEEAKRIRSALDSQSLLISSLQSSLSDRNSQSAHSDQLLRNEIDFLSSLNSSLQAKVLEGVQTSQVQMEKMREVMEKVREEEEKRKGLEKEISRLTLSSSSLLSDLSSSRSLLASLSKEKAVVEHRLGVVMGQVQMMEGERVQASRWTAKWATQISALQQQIDHLQSLLHSQSSSLSSLHSQLALALSHKSHLEKELRKYSAVCDDITSQLSTSSVPDVSFLLNGSDPEGTSQDSREGEEEEDGEKLSAIETVQTLVLRQKQKAKLLKQQCADLTSRLDHLSISSREEVEKERRERERVEEELAGMRLRCAVVEDQMQDASDQSLEFLSRIHELQTLLSSSSLDLSSSRSELASSRSLLLEVEAELKEEKAKAHLLEGELEKERREREVERAEGERRGQQVEGLTRRNASLETEASSLRSSLASLHSETSSLRTTSLALREEMEVLRSSHSSLSHDLSSLSSLNSSLSSDLASLKPLNASLSAEVDSLKSLNASLHSELASLRSQLEESKARERETKRQLDERIQGAQIQGQGQGQGQSPSRVNPVQRQMSGSRLFMPVRMPSSSSLLSSSATDRAFKEKIDFSAVRKGLRSVAPK